jgi:Na+/H+ antiporter NhaD/arsenite permease-like protein
VLPLAVLAATYLAIAGRRWAVLPLGRPTFALIGAVAMVALGVLTPNEAYAAVDLPTLGLLLGMMIVGVQLDRDGALDRGKDWFMAGCRTGFGALVRVTAAAALLSAVLVNDTVCVLLTPVVVRWCLERRLPLEPFLIALATASNLGSALTLVGNPQNILIAGLSGLGFVRYLTLVGPAVAVALGAHLAVLAVLYGRSLRDPLPAMPGAPRAPLRWGSVAVTAAMLPAFLWGADLSFTALAAAAILFLWRREDPSEVLARVDWSLLLFFGALFVVVRGGLESDVLTSGLDAVTALGGPGTLGGHLALAGGVVVGSNVVSNVPFVLLTGSALSGGTELGWAELAFVSTLAGNLTLVGSVANLIVAEVAKDHHDLGFRAYARVGVVSTVLGLTLGVPVLVLTASLLT